MSQEKVDEKKVSRRSYLKYAGAGVVVVAVAGAGAYYATLPPAPSTTTAQTTAPVTTAPVTTAPVTTAPVTTAAALLGQYPGVEISNIAVAASISKGLYWARDNLVGKDGRGWQALTGAKLDIVEVPFADLAQKVLTDMTTGAGKFDTIQTGSWLYGDYFAANPPYIISIDDYMAKMVPPTTYDHHTDMWTPDSGVQFPYWDPKEVIPNVVRQDTWPPGGPLKWYSIPYDNDHFPMFSRRDLLGDPPLGIPARTDLATAFKSKYGYDLAPPTNWDQYMDVAQFFNSIGDWDPSRPGTKYGTTAALKRSTQGYFWYIGLATTFSILKGPNVDKYHWVWEFDPETMEPLINQPGNVAALEWWVKCYKTAMPADTINWDLGQAWNLWLRGDCALEWNAPDVPALAQDSSVANVQGQCTTTQLPGSMKVWDRQNSNWLTLDTPNYVPVCMGGTWSNVISRFSKNPEAAYHWSSWLNQEPVMKQLSTAGVYGVDAGRYYMLPAPWGSEPKDLPTYTKSTMAGRNWTWNYNDALSYLTDMGTEFVGNPPGSAKGWFYPFIVPGSARYQDAMDLAVNQALSGTTSAQAALDACAKAWDGITSDYGLDAQKASYQTSIGYGKPINAGL